MDKQTLDWKDVAQSYYDKSVTLAILIVLFAFIISPQLDIKTQTKAETKTAKSEVVLTEEKQRIEKPPEQVVKPQINIVIDTSIGASDSGDEGFIIDTIEDTNIESSLGINFATKNEDKGSSRDEFSIPDDVYSDEDPFPETRINADYPKALQDQGIGGTVMVELEVFSDGTVGAVKVKKSSGVDLLDKSAVKAIKSARFVPGKANGKPISMRVVIPVIFSSEK
jgi:protein TonB